MHRKQQTTETAFTRRLILRETGFTLPEADNEATIQEIYARLTSDRQRNQLILDDMRQTLATGRYIGEGFDDARLDTLFLALPFWWKGMLVQYAGRLHRLHPGKEEVRVYDYVDVAVPMLAKMHDKRMKGFKAMGYLQTTPRTI